MQNYKLERNPDRLFLLDVQAQINEKARLQYTTIHTEETLSSQGKDAVVQLALSFLYEQLNNRPKQNQASQNYILLLGNIPNDNLYNQPRLLFDDILLSYKSSLLDSASVFTNEHLARHLKTAIFEYSKRKPLIKNGSIDLIPNIKTYSAPNDLFEIFETLWAKNEKLTKNPWDFNYPRNLPRLNAFQRNNGYELVLNRAVTESEIQMFGKAFEFSYKAFHILGNDLNQTTITENAIPIILLRAQAEAAREMAMRNIHKPVSLNTPVGGVPSNGTAMGIYQALIIEFEKQVS